MALIAAGLVMLAAVPVYQRVRESARERQDALLLESVGARISQAVPEALEPLHSPRRIP